MRSARTSARSPRPSVTTRVPRPPPPASALMIIAPSGAERREERLRLVERDRAVEAADHRHGGRRRRLPRAGLVAEQLEVLRPAARRTSGRPRRRLREIAALGEEAVARMDRIAAGRLGRRDHLARCRGRRPRPARAAAAPRRPRAHAGSPRRPRNTRRRSAAPCRPRRGRCGWRSRRDWRSAVL